VDLLIISEPIIDEYARKFNLYTLFTVYITDFFLRRELSPN